MILVKSKGVLTIQGCFLLLPNSPRRGIRGIQTRAALVRFLGANPCQAGLAALNLGELGFVLLSVRSRIPRFGFAMVQLALKLC